MKVDEAYYKAEERDGFYVEGMMKRYWAAQIEILEEVDRICRKYGLTYYADSGTLLGTIRHKGFIPWDDDLDLTMKRKDYQKFTEIVQEELPEKWRIFTYYTERYQCEDGMRIVNNTAIELSSEHLKRFHGCPFVTGIDINPLDYITRDREKAELQVELLQWLWHIIGALRAGADTEETEVLLRQIEKNCGVKLVNDGTIIRQIYQLIETISMLFTEEESGEIAILKCMIMPGRQNYRYKKEWFSDVIYMPFEKTVVPVPVGYNEVLQVAYGDYMKPVVVRIGHEYPLYKPQLQAIEAWREKECADKELVRLIEDIMSGKDKRQIVFKI